MPYSHVELPNQHQLVLQVTNAVWTLGNSVAARAIVDYVVSNTPGSEDLLRVTYPKRPQKSVFVDRIERARSIAKILGILDRPSRGVYRISALGESLVSKSEEDALESIRRLDKQRRNKKTKEKQGKPFQNTFEDQDLKWLPTGLAALGNLENLLPSTAAIEAAGNFDNLISKTTKETLAATVKEAWNYSHDAALTSAASIAMTGINQSSNLQKITEDYSDTKKLLQGISDLGRSAHHIWDIYNPGSAKSAVNLALFSSHFSKEINQLFVDNSEVIEHLFGEEDDSDYDSKTHTTPAPKEQVTRQFDDIRDISQGAIFTFASVLIAYLFWAFDFMSSSNTDLGKQFFELLKNSSIFLTATWGVAYYEKGKQERMNE